MLSKPRELVVASLSTWPVILCVSCSALTDSDGLTRVATLEDASAVRDVVLEPDSSVSDVSAMDASTTLDSPMDAQDSRVDSAGHDATDAASDVKSDAPPIAISARATNATQAGSSAVATLLMGNIAAHDAIVICIVFDAQTTLSGVTDSLGNTYRTILGPWNATQTYYVVLAEDTAAGSDTVTITLGAPGSNFEVYAVEYAGLATSNAFDVSSWAVGTSPAADGMSSGIANTTSARELIVGFGLSGTVAVGTGFVLRSNFDANVLEDKVVTSAGPYETRATMTSGDAWAMLMVTFRGQ